MSEMRTPLVCGIYDISFKNASFLLSSACLESFNYQGDRFVTIRATDELFMN